MNMRLRGSISSSALLLLSLALSARAAPELRFEPLWAGLKFEKPVAVVADPGHAGPLYVVEQEGRIWAVAEGKRSLFLDESPRVRTEGPEEGLLCLAFHPAPDKLGRAYIIYSVKGAKPRKTRLAELSAGQERVLLEVEKPWGNHNGATLAFGPDGYLYVSLGDGGGAGDPHSNAQDLGSLLGKVLRMDVDQTGASTPYAIPKDNPFAARAKARPEIWAYGLRNPWRMSFDAVTGKLWAGDVGQDKYEEVDVIRKGGNYGWNRREGSHPFKAGPDTGPYIEPVFDYGRDLGFCVTGGGVVRSAGPAALQGRYVFADYGSRRVFSLDAAKPGPATLQEHGKAPEPVSSFGTDAAGHLYLIGYLGTIYSVQ